MEGRHGAARRPHQRVSGHLAVWQFGRVLPGMEVFVRLGLEIGRVLGVGIGVRKFHAYLAIQIG
jgi:hypothetical protein